MNYSKKTRIELLVDCTAAGLKCYKSYTKNKLIELLVENEKDTETPENTDVVENVIIEPSTIIKESAPPCRLRPKIAAGGAGESEDTSLPITHITLYNGDCMTEMKMIEDASIDMILCDLPYGMTKNSWDVVIPFDKLWEQYNRIIKDNGAIVLFGSQPFTSLMIVSNLKNFRYSLVWEKNKFSDFLNSKRKPMKVNEDIAIFYKAQPVYNPQYWYSTPYKRWNTQEAVNKQTNYGSHKENVVESKDGRRLPTTVLKFNRVERPEHPTQKPVDLLEWLIKTYTNTGAIILDNCMGVGSTGVACKNTNRSFIGIEINEDYFDIAKKRMEI